MCIALFRLRAVGSHIKPWAEDKSNRLNPHNGICLNSIHDRAFDRGLITIDKGYKIIIQVNSLMIYSRNMKDIKLQFLKSLNLH